MKEEDPERAIWARRRLEELASELITERKRLRQSQQQLQALNETLEARVEERTAQVRRLASKLTMAEQQERRRISQLLHDDLQQLLYGIQLKARMLKRGLPREPTDALRQQAGDIAERLGEAIDTTRRLTVDLSPPVLKREGLVEALQWLAVQMKETHGLELQVEPSCTPHFSGEDMEVLLFQLVRELLFNVIKHAGVRHARVEIEEAGKNCLLRVIDEGCGFDAEALQETHEADGFGLFHVRERLGLFGGRLEIDAAPGRGTRATLMVPTAPGNAGT